MNRVGKLRAVKKLKKLLASKGIMQSWVAGKLGITPAYLSMLLNGKREVTAKLCEDFNLLTDHIKGDQR